MKSMALRDLADLTNSASSKTLVASSMNGDRVVYGSCALFITVCTTMRNGEEIGQVFATHFAESQFMATSRDDIFRGALSLADRDRVDLIAALVDSLDSHVDEGVEEAWRVEIARRAKELESGTVQSIPWEIVRERLARGVRG